jgi:hypothetical protein
MKWWHWLLVAIVAWLVFFRRRGPAVNVGREYPADGGDWNGRTGPNETAVSRPTRNPLTDQEQAVAAIAATPWPGGGGNPYASRLADQSRYPGWYITESGGWVNPGTGEYFSPGTSPEAIYEVNEYVLGITERPTYEPMPEKLNDYAASFDRGIQIVY